MEPSPLYSFQEMVLASKARSPTKRTTDTEMSLTDSNTSDNSQVQSVGNDRPENAFSQIAPPGNHPIEIKAIEK